MDSREKYYFEPSKLPAGDRIYYDKIKPIIDGLLVDLRNSGCLRKASRNDAKKFIDLMKDKDEMGMAFNRLVELFYEKKRYEDFLKINKEYFTDRNFSYLFMSQLYLLYLIPIEMFKNFLLFYLRRGNRLRFKHKMTLNPFLCALKHYSPAYGNLLEKELDSDLRNAFAHGLFCIEPMGDLPVLSYYENLAQIGRIPHTVSLYELMRGRSKQNILYNTLVNSIAEKMEKGFFI